MRIAVCSDIHLEFGPIVLENTDNADVLVLGGDICLVKELGDKDDTLNFRGQRFHEFFQKCCDNFRDVIYIMGNHEHYHGDFGKSATDIRNSLSYLPNLHFLDKQQIGRAHV